MKKTTGLEKACAKALFQHAVNGFFNMLFEVVEEYNILPENLYNMDKKGLQLGIGAKTVVARGLITGMMQCPCFASGACEAVR